MGEAAARQGVGNGDGTLPDDVTGSADAGGRPTRSAKVAFRSGAGRAETLYQSLRAGTSVWASRSSVLRDLRQGRRGAAGRRRLQRSGIPARPSEHELVVHYQPIVDLQRGHTVGFEALVRWQHPARGLLSPDTFLPTAEEDGFITEIDRWSRDRAIRQLGEWQRRFPSVAPPTMHVNLSGRSLSDPDLLSSLRETIEEAGVDPADLVVELTETVLIDDDPATTEIVAGLKGLGVGLALDDFGTAFSSISYLRRFPIDYLKLDASFVREIPGSSRATGLVIGVNHLAAAVGTAIVAEGIERPEQAAALRSMGCRFGQGYLYSRPAAAAEFEELLASGRAGRGVTPTMPAWAGSRVPVLGAGDAPRPAARASGLRRAGPGVLATTPLLPPVAAVPLHDG